MMAEVRTAQDAIRTERENIEEQIEAAREAIVKKERAKAAEAASASTKELTERVAELAKALTTSQNSELELRKAAAKVADREKALDLEVARRVDADRTAIFDKAKSTLQTEFHLNLAAKDKQLSDALTQVAALQTRLESGSQQLQGEILELDIEKSLRENFPLDNILPVPKGVNGADVIQEVGKRSGGFAGTIIWELKRTKTFNVDWIAKLKADQRVAKSDLAILVSSALPDEVKGFGLVGGVWVSSIENCFAVAVALRAQLLEVDLMRKMNSGKKEKMELIYEYISGQPFRQRVEAIVSAFTEMQSDIAEERRVSERRWAKREKQVASVIANTAGMYGDLQAQISLTPIPLLEDGR